jgi:hypothetical protein
MCMYRAINCSVLLFYISQGISSTFLQSYFYILNALVGVLWFYYLRID